MSDETPATTPDDHCPYWSDGKHCFIPESPGRWPEQEMPGPWEGKTKYCACGAEVKTT